MALAEDMTDEVLMLLVKQGELKKASDLFTRYNKAIYNFFVKITFDRELSHDLTQNVFLRMIKYRHTYNGDKKFKSWVYQIARNVYADHYGKNKIMFSDNADVENITNKIISIDEEMINHEKEQLLYISMFKLKPDQRELLILTRFEKMKYEQVAEVLDTSVANVKVKVHRAINDLRKVYLQLEKI